MMTKIERAQGCLLGQCAGDALGNPVEFQKPTKIQRLFPNGLRDLIESSIWGTIPGQITDDSEMALALARTLIKVGTYNANAVRKAYLRWYESKPFDCGGTVQAGLLGTPNIKSESNGALMRISPLGIFGASHKPQQVARWAQQDAMLTHPNRVCQEANVLFVMALAHAIRTGCSKEELLSKIEGWAEQLPKASLLPKVVRQARLEPPVDYVKQRGWVLIAFQNALWQLLHASSLEEGVVDTVMRGGDTDTNAAIAGALLGAVYGRSQVPKRWEEGIISCRPEVGLPGVLEPRPEYFWTRDILEVAVALVEGKRE